MGPCGDGSAKVVAVIADTHGSLPGALAASLSSCEKIVGRAVDLVLHAGDVAGRSGDSRPVLDSLEAIAPTRAVQGNTDRDDLPVRVDVRCGLRFLVEHGHELTRRPTPGDTAHVRERLVPKRGDVVVTGHSHVPEFFKENGVIFLNPGAAGPKRFKLPGRRCVVLRLADNNLQDAWVLDCDCDSHSDDDRCLWTPWRLTTGDEDDKDDDDDASGRGT